MSFCAEIQTDLNYHCQNEGKENLQSGLNYFTEDFQKVRSCGLCCFPGWLQKSPNSNNLVQHSHGTCQFGTGRDPLQLSCQEVQERPQQPGEQRQSPPRLPAAPALGTATDLSVAWVCVMAGPLPIPTVAWGRERASRWNTIVFFLPSLCNSEFQVK